MHNFKMFPAGSKRAFSLLFNFSKFWENYKTAELMNAIFENSSPPRCFRLKNVKYEILILSSDSRYIRSVAWENMNVKYK